MSWSGVPRTITIRPTLLFFFVLSLLWSLCSHRDKYPLLHTILNVSFCPFVGSLIVTPRNDGLSVLQNHKPSIHPTLQEAEAVRYRRGLSLTATSL